MFHKMLGVMVILVIAALSAVLADNTVPAGSPGESIMLRHCLAEYRQTALLGSPLEGVLQDRLVDLGSRVKAGQVLGRIQDLEQRAEMARNKYEAENPAAVRTAEARYELARIKTRYAKELAQERAVSKLEYDVLKREEETARLAVEETKVALHLAELRYRQSEAAARIREIVSPYDGMIVQVFKQKGEAVSTLPNNPVFRIVNTEVVRVTGHVDVVDAWRIRPGQAVRVSPETVGPALPIQKEVFTGEIVFVDQEIDPRTRTCRVVSEVKNRKDLLRGGLELKMEVLISKAEPDAWEGKR